MGHCMVVAHAESSINWGKVFRAGERPGEAVVALEKESDTLREFQTAPSSGISNCSEWST
jgi:hypothetical protein